MTPSKQRKPLEEPINRRTELLIRLKRRGHQPWVQPSHERKKGRDSLGKWQ